MNIKRLIITDMDNTLYDWVTYFAASFVPMADKLALLLNLPIEQIYREFKMVHQRYGNSEQPFAVFELPSVLQGFPGASREELRKELSGPLKAFNSARKRHLTLYPTVLPTLAKMKDAEIELVAHTEAVLVNSYYRLQRLEISGFFSRLYTLQEKVRVPPTSPAFEFPSAEFVQFVSRTERKPNPRLLLDICAREGVAPAEAVYVGDSITRDISMAKEAGVCAVWAKYGTRYDKSLWNTLVEITHWDEEEVIREEYLRRRYEDARPDYVIESFSELLPIAGVQL